ncbi:MAG: hypothetical protein CMQ19_07445 [Gammaproteobacteria bacterium]|nr:hypothetical protein [Gammaproteobacteria bacterium]
MKSSFAKGETSAKYPFVATSHVGCLRSSIQWIDFKFATRKFLVVIPQINMVFLSTHAEENMNGFSYRSS